MKKIVFLGLTLCCLILGIIYLVPKIYSVDNYKQQIINLVKNNFNREMVINGNIEIQTFPVPKILINDVKILNFNGFAQKDLIDAKLINVNLEFFSLISGKLKASSFEIDDAEVNLEINTENKKNWELSKSNGKESQDLPKYIKFKNTKFNYIGSDHAKKTIGNVNAEIKANSQNANIKGNFIFKNQNVDFSWVFDNKDQNNSIKAELLSSDFNFKIDGKLIYNNSVFDKISGKIEGELLKHDLITSSIKSTFPFIPDFKNKILSDKIKISGDITISDDKINATNLNIDSSSVKGNSDIELLIVQEPSLGINLNFKEINFDNLFKDQIVSNKENKEIFVEKNDDDFISKDFINLSNSNNFKINFNLNAEKFTFSTKELKNIFVNFGINEDKFVINKLSADFPDDLSLEIKDSNTVLVDNIYVLVGKIHASGKNLKDNLNWLLDNKYIQIKDNLNNFNLDSKIIISQKELTFLNVNGEFEGGKLSGRWTIKNDFQNRLVNDAEIYLDSFDLSDISLPQLKKNLDILLTTSNENQYLSEFRSLRANSDIIKFKFGIKNSTYDKINIKNFAGAIDITQGQILFSDFNIDTDVAKLEYFDFSLDARSLKPNIILNTQGKKLDLNTISNIFYGEKQNEVEKLDSIPDQSVSVDSNNIKINQKWSKEPHNIFRFDKFTGKIKFDIYEVNYSKFYFDRLFFEGKIHNDMFLIQSCLGKIYGGALDIKGNYSYTLDAPTLSLSYAFSDISLDKIYDLLDIKKYIDGKIDFSGNLFTKGYTPYEMAKNVTLNMPLKLKNVTLESFDLERVIDLSSRRIEAQDSEIFTKINESFNDGKLTIKLLEGKLVAKEGQLQTKDITFNSLYSNGVFVGAFNLFDWYMEALTYISFTPAVNASPVVISLKTYGFIDNYKTIVNKEQLFNYIADEFKIKSNDHIKQEQLNRKKEEDIANRTSKFIFEKLQAMR